MSANGLHGDPVMSPRWLRAVLPAYLVWYLALLLAELAGWFARPVLWLGLLALATIVAMAGEYAVSRVAALRVRLAPASLRLFAAITLVLVSTVGVSAQVRVLFVPLVLLWMIPGALELEVRLLTAAVVYALVLYLGIGLFLSLAPGADRQYYANVEGFIVLAALLSACIGVARYLRRVHAQSAWQEKQLAEARSQVQALVTQDSLTRAFKRHYFVQLLRQEKARVDRYGGIFSICLLDIDRYAQLHERYGETVCTQVLRELAERVVRTVRIMDVVGHIHDGEEPVGRYGTTQFGLMLPSTGLVGAMDCAERLRTDLESTPFKTAAGGIYVTIAAGAAQYAGEVEVEALLDRAGEALKLAQRGGGNAVRAVRPAGDGGRRPPKTQ